MWIVLVVDVDHRRSTATRMQGDSEDYELKQMRDVAAAKKRWEALVCQKNLFWVQGGVEAAEEEDLAREGPLPFKFAGIGGLLEFLGWTDQQRAAAAKENWSCRLVFSARLAQVGVILLADALFPGAQQLGRYLQDIRSL
ncbi:rhodanese-like domain-containing protein 11, chloroplastic [Pyrus x bretschneideri]|uniref:rhodanese-like domain-containing protein 11, chloroplastic n=1 Tax=Pyrus x bretschneideri TaxID=225117 RepID=UPI00202E46D4|nr:rhodanese-like domain-containing protein 11, chloroplastic [Pyrus x bretschneideri]